MQTTIAPIATPLKLSSSNPYSTASPPLNPHASEFVPTTPPTSNSASTSFTGFGGASVDLLGQRFSQWSVDIEEEDEESDGSPLGNNNAPSELDDQYNFLWEDKDDRVTGSEDLTNGSDQNSNGDRAKTGSVSNGPKFSEDQFSFLWESQFPLNVKPTAASGSYRDPGIAAAFSSASPSSTGWGFPQSLSVLKNGSAGPSPANMTEQDLINAHTFHEDESSEREETSQHKFPWEKSSQGTQAKVGENGPSSAPMPQRTIPVVINQPKTQQKSANVRSSPSSASNGSFQAQWFVPNVKNAPVNQNGHPNGGPWRSPSPNVVPSSWDKKAASPALSVVSPTSPQISSSLGTSPRFPGQVSISPDRGLGKSPVSSGMSKSPLSSDAARLNPLDLLETMFDAHDRETLIQALETNDFDIKRTVQYLLRSSPNGPANHSTQLYLSTSPGDAAKPPPQKGVEVQRPIDKKRREDQAPVCKYFLKGSCLIKNCPFRHTTEVACKYWLRGFCSRGDQCDYKHAVDLAAINRVFEGIDMKPPSAAATNGPIPVQLDQSDFPSLRDTTKR
eukprot:TRINITY_DN2246_c0_g1_i1.p1 TRINITY_DN2246_c0_g1~~TRINITY_DN2246_c0_g1_i1.p1  ORF type:complete len:560 (-),score=126.04 TRINITY_DN2246_c0_g1_i1:21-1700(-)